MQQSTLFLIMLHCYKQTHRNYQRAKLAAQLAFLAAQDTILCASYTQESAKPQFFPASYSHHFQVHTILCIQKKLHTFRRQNPSSPLQSLFVSLTAMSQLLFHASAGESMRMHILFIPYADLVLVQAWAMLMAGKIE